ncbi:uncharacterized protein LOC109612779 [Musca domestica]|uniref:Uncharacterized protein LOC109612779 n=1 Tax=Musca domestica TaxID=7370 RepID=A0A9J7IDE4_MUSDO|nr:uncharacterized protein LOC109612779 [Musca domestica]
MPDNYNIFSNLDIVEWPEYVSERQLEGEYLEKAEKILDMALVTLEAYDGPRYIVDKVIGATRKAIYFYEINADLIDSTEAVHKCNIMILYEPWMKANCIAQAVFEFANAEKENMIVVKRKDEVPYYRSPEIFDGNTITHAVSYIPLRNIYKTVT